MIELMKAPENSGFKVTVDEYATSPDPARACWNAMHTCKSNGKDRLKPINATKSLIDNALAFGHWHVLDHAFVKLDFTGFPHDTVMQWRTHQRSSTLVQSMRYADELYSDCAEGKIPSSELFYFGELSPHEQDFSHEQAVKSCQQYVMALRRGHPKELARRYLVSSYRQNFTVSSNVTGWLHCLDQRGLKDTQIEARIAADMAMSVLTDWWPQLFTWYKEKDYQKNKLRP